MPEPPQEPLQEPVVAAGRGGREDCLSKLQSEIEADSLASLVSQRLDLEVAMRAVLLLEQRLAGLTNTGPDFTEGRLVPVPLNSLQQTFPFLGTQHPFLHIYKQQITHFSQHVNI